MPLDNLQNKRPDWYELWVIKIFIEKSGLAEDSWHGFFSPKFFAKTRLKSSDVYSFLEKLDSSAEVVTISYSWEQTAYFLSHFEQGDLFHPGLKRVSQHFFDRIAQGVDLDKIVGHSGNSAFCNFVIAKPIYWRKWLELATAFFNFVEDENEALSAGLKSTTNYGSVLNQTPMKTFVQERFPAVLLATNPFRTSVLDISDRQPMFARLFEEHPRTRRLLLACDALKSEHVATGDPDLLTAYWKLRAQIPKKF